MRSHRIAGSPSVTGQITSPSQSQSSHLLPKKSKSNVSATGQFSSPQSPPPYTSHRSSARSRKSRRVDNNNAPATDTQIIRITCGQIFQALNGASDSLSGEMLQHLCAEILVFSEGAINSKINRPSMEIDTIHSHPVRDKSSTRIENRPDPANGSLIEAITPRMAEVVENKANSLPRQDNSNIEPQLFPTKYALDMFTKLPSYDIYLNICDPDLMADQQQLRRDYLAFKRSDSNVPFMIYFFLCGAFFMGTGFVWFNDVHTYRQHPTAILSILFGILASFCLLWVTLNRVVFLSYQYNIVFLQRYHDFVVKLYNSPYGQWPDNGAILFVALSTGFYLVNIVLMDLCDPDIVVNNWSNNHAACSFIEPPPESFVLTMIFVLVLQIVARGVSRMALVCSWIVCIVAVNMSIYLSDSGSYVWMNLLQLFLLCISYELERQPLCQFIKTTKAIVAGEVAAELRQQLAAYETLQASQALESKRSLVRYVMYGMRLKPPF